MNKAGIGLGLFALAVLTACQSQLKWQSMPNNVLVADQARAFTADGDGRISKLELPEDKWLLGNPGAERLTVFNIQSEELVKQGFGIAKSEMSGEFAGGAKYLLHAEYRKPVRDKYKLLCRVRAASSALEQQTPGITGKICSRILCPAAPYTADRLLDEFAELRTLPQSFDRAKLAQINVEPLTGGVSASDICARCSGSDWEARLIPSCRPLTPPVTAWVPYGPGPNTQGQVENIINREVAGAVNAVAPHPTQANIVYVGSVNGGIWRTDNAMDANPTWQRQIDDGRALSIGAVEFDPTDPSHRTLVAGIGRFSSYYTLGSARLGILRTTDGTNWTLVDGGGDLVGLNISGVAPRGATIVVAANAAETPGNEGLWRSTNTGASWTQLSGQPGSGVPDGDAFDLTGDPADPARLYAGIRTRGIYRSTDSGATWTRVGNAAMHAMAQSANNVYVAMVRYGRLAGVYRSGDGGASWTAMDLPSTAEGGIHPGGQGTIHLSIAADPGNANIVYIGGDRQDWPGFWPNSIGATDWTGNLFRGDASRPAGSQFTPLTHDKTASNSAPHADSRDMDVAANGVLIEVDDGGVYRRTAPLTNTGDWFSMNGDIQTTELHNVAWDANADVVLGGAQDPGTPEPRATMDGTWRSVSPGAGGAVAVDDTGTAGISVRYSSYQNLGAFLRRIVDAGNVVQSEVFPALIVLNGGQQLQPNFTTPIEINNEDPTRLIIGARNSLYESLDQGDTITEVLTAAGVRVKVNAWEGLDPIAYGGDGNADMLYVGSDAKVFVRSAAAPANIAESTAYPGTSWIVDIGIDPDNPNTAFVADAWNVFRTTDAGATWTDVTGNFATLDAGEIRSLAFRNGQDPTVIVGTDTGVYAAAGPNFNTWGRLATGLPRVPVFDLDYDLRDRVLVAGTLGRGAWILRNY